MDHQKFEDIINEILDAARNTLTRKSEGYSNEDDRLHNFRTGAALNGISMEQVCWGMATKHIVSIRDMVMSGEIYPADIWDEKLGDAINYFALLKAITVEADDDEIVIADDEDEAISDDKPVMNIKMPRQSSGTILGVSYSPGEDSQARLTKKIEDDIHAQRKRDLDAIKRVAKDNK